MSCFRGVSIVAASLPSEKSAGRRLFIRIRNRSIANKPGHTLALRVPQAACTGRPPGLRAGGGAADAARMGRERQYAMRMADKKLEHSVIWSDHELAVRMGDDGTESCDDSFCVFHNSILPACFLSGAVPGTGRVSFHRCTANGVYRNKLPRRSCFISTTRRLCAVPWRWLEGRRGTHDSVETLTVVEGGARAWLLSLVHAWKGCTDVSCGCLTATGIEMVSQPSHQWWSLGASPPNPSLGMRPTQALRPRFLCGV